MTLIAEIVRRDRLLGITGAILLLCALASLAASTIDARQVTGLNAWIKPAKFFVSIAIFFWTLAWFMPETAPRRARAVAAVRWVVWVALLTEIVLITAQAARSVGSHFNVSTPIDGAIFSIMGAMILINTLAVAGFGFTLHPGIDPARAGYQWGIRLGLLVFVVGSFQGFTIVANMGHTVPGPDGGAGLPFLNWSTDRGDLRVAHFIGLHALQALPLFGYALDRTTAPPAARRRVVATATGVWLLVMGWALLQALAGRPLVGL